MDIDGMDMAVNRGAAAVDGVGLERIADQNIVKSRVKFFRFKEFLKYPLIFYL